MTRFVIGVDPGDRHVGVASWGGLDGSDQRVRCREYDAVDAVGIVRTTLGLARDEGMEPVLVVEEFQLYADKAAVQIGSAMETSQMIGQLKLVAEMLGVPFEGQGALIKTAMRAQCKARGIKLEGSTHAKDAGLHVAHYVLYNDLGLR